MQSIKPYLSAASLNLPAHLFLYPLIFPMIFDTVITNGIVVNATGIIYPPYSDIGITDGIITCIGSNLQGKVTVDAEGGFVTPGGIDAHAHVDQQEKGGAYTTTPKDVVVDHSHLPPVVGDSFQPASKSALCGGTTTLVTFAAQSRDDDSVLPLIEAYKKKADGFSYCDYGVHLILTNASDNVVNNELHQVLEDGISSVKIYMSYESHRLSDEAILKVADKTSRLGMTIMIHTENWDMIKFIVSKLYATGKTDPYYHAVAHPSVAEDEASYRAISLARLLDASILIVHVSTEAATRNIRNAQTGLLPVYGETCPQYLYLMTEKMKVPNFEGAKYVCSPPLRESTSDVDALWDGIANGTFTIVSSDHCPFYFDNLSGKRRGIVNGIAMFSEIPNGLPGLETRVPLVFQGVSDGKISIQKFVEVTSYNPAMLYGLTSKGQIAPGFDADLVIWYKNLEPFKITNDLLHHQFDYTPFEDLTVKNWPRYTFLRGTMMWNRDEGRFTTANPEGKFIKRSGNQFHRKPPGAREWEE